MSTSPINLVNNIETVYMTREAAMAAGRKQAAAEDAARELMAKRHPAYNVKQTSKYGQMSSMVPGWEVSYPVQCNGRMADLGYVASLGYGGAYFIHFDAAGEPTGLEADMLTKAARARLLAMRRDFRFQR